MTLANEPISYRGQRYYNQNEIPDDVMQVILSSQATPGEQPEPPVELPQLTEEDLLNPEKVEPEPEPEPEPDPSSLPATEPEPEMEEEV